MSQSQIDATAVLCRLLEFEVPQINGQALKDQYGDAAIHLLRERLLLHGQPLDWVTCPDCGVETAKVAREIALDRIALHCPECLEVWGSRALRETYKVAVQKVLAGVLNGLSLTAVGMKVIAPHLAWRLGTTEARRGKHITWYFARRLRQGDVAGRLREQIGLEKTASSCVVLTSTELPLPADSVLSGFDVRPLFVAGRIGQSTFEFFADRNQGLGAGRGESAEAPPRTTLRFVRTQGKVFVEGTAYDLEPRQKAILVALLDDRDHEMDKETLKARCGSQAQRFSPSKEFDRNPAVYKAFIRYQQGDGRYALLIPAEDKTFFQEFGRG